MGKVIRRTILTVVAVSIIVSTLLTPVTAFARANKYNCFSTNPWIGSPVNWRAWCGVFYNGAQDGGQSAYLWPGGLNAGGWWAPIESPDTFIRAVNKGLNEGDLHAKTAAAFYILSMLGYYPSDMYNVKPDRAWAEFGRWESLVRGVSSYGQVGPYSWQGPAGYVNFREWLPPPPCGALDSYYMLQNEDVAPSLDQDDPKYRAVGVYCDPAFPSNPRGYPAWEAVVFHTWDGNRSYTLDRHCGNMRWDWNRIPERPLNYRLNSIVTPDASIVQPGTTVNFTMNIQNDPRGINNAVGTPFNSVQCEAFVNVYNGRRSSPPENSDMRPTSGSGIGGLACPQWHIDPWQNPQVGSYSRTISDADIGKSICVTLNVWPSRAVDNVIFGNASTERCVVVASRPYLSVFGGDVSVGGGVYDSSSGSCNQSATSNARITAWNTGSTRGYAGAGSEFAAFALGAIDQFATAQGNVSGVVQPYTLQFWNYGPHGGYPTFPGGAPVFQTTSSNPSFNVGSGSPGPGVWSDYFLARVTRQINVPSGTFYNFQVVADDGIRIFVDGALIIDHWVDQPAATYNAARYLTAGNHNIAIEYYERGGLAIMDFSYSAAFMPSYSVGTPPTDFTFANTSGVWGGNFGSAQCISDYFRRKDGANPATIKQETASTVKVNDFQDAETHIRSGNLELEGGNINPNQRTELYVDGDVYITKDIKYVGNWNMNKLPLFMVVATGNIYIDSSVGQLDGLYVAQRRSGISDPNNSSSGMIYTCATGMGAAADPKAAGYRSLCDRQLVVNGAFVAHSVVFLRTNGDLSRAALNESAATTAAAEVFNYSPTMWMVPPVNGGGKSDNYDAISSLPPVL